MVRPKKELDVRQVFRAPRILTLPQLCRRLHASRSTVLRRLLEHGYFSSYNQSGRFLTIEQAADFDARGLWVHQWARFSQHGNLKQTVLHFVQQSPQGVTHEDLTRLLGVRTHNTLLQLVAEEKIRRERLGPTFVYLARAVARRRKQVRERQALLAEPQQPRPTSPQIIATLLELIFDPHVERLQLVRRCQRKGVSISPRIVDAIFEKYELDKKRAP
jgi:hypothetical protein